MATIKSYTDLEQSKVLVKILSSESADMRYGYIAPYEFSDRMYEGGYDDIPYPEDFLKKNPNFSENEYDGDFPSWSLAVLLDVLPEIQGSKPVISLYDNYITYPHMSNLHTKSDNLVDACYELILKLNELKML